MEKIWIPIKRLPEGDGLPYPEYATFGSSGMDIRAAVESEERIPPGGIKLISAGFSIAVPKGYEAQIRSRSGLALKHGVVVLNSPGTIDSDYRGPVGVILMNLGERDFLVRRGDRIAQLVVTPVVSGFGKLCYYIFGTPSWV